MKSFVITILLCVYIKRIDAQNFLTKDTLIKIDRQNLSNINDHFYKKFDLKAEEYNCSIFNYFHNEFPRFIVFSEQSELVYFENYIDSNYKNIKSIGYLRLVIDSNLNFCWEKDLIWTKFNKNGTINSSELYKNGKLIKTFSP
jgi:hypothetical protein